jgi:hypothetical protein
MSKEFERLKTFLQRSGPNDWEPQVDLAEAAKLAARWSWLVRLAREQRSQLQKRAAGESARFGPDASTD